MPKIAVHTSLRNSRGRSLYLICHGRKVANSFIKIACKKDVVTWYIYIADLLRLTRTNRNMEKEIGTVIDQTKMLASPT